VARSAMEWHRKTPWMARQSVKPEQQARTTSKSVKQHKKTKN